MKTSLTEPRLICENGLEKQIAELVAPLLISINYRLVRVKFTQANLQIMAEKTDGKLTISDCEKIHKLISPILDIEDIITTSYDLEISSPGLERPLVRKSDFIAHIGYKIALSLSDHVKYKAKLLTVHDNHITIINSEDTEINIAYSDIKQAVVIVTEELIKTLLTNKKKAKD